MTKVRFSDLTPEQIDIICNGCQGKGHWLNPPDWIFTASYDQHDFNYWIGYTEEDRAKADWQFYQAMLYDAQQQPWYLRSWYKLMAWLYYQAVRLFATDYFYYGDGERTLEDLEKALESENT